MKCFSVLYSAVRCCLQLAIAKRVKKMNKYRIQNVKIKKRIKLPFVEAAWFGHKCIFVDTREALTPSLYPHGTENASIFLFFFKNPKKTLNFLLLGNILKEYVSSYIVNISISHCKKSSSGRLFSFNRPPKFTLNTSLLYLCHCYII